MTRTRVEGLRDNLCSAGIHFWKRVRSSMIDPSSSRRECRDCGTSPSLNKRSLVAVARTLMLRKRVLQTYLNPNSPRFAARSEGGSAEAGFRDRINRYSEETLRALLAARSDPSFRYSYRICALTEPVLRDTCAVPDLLGTSHTMSYSKSIQEAMMLIHSLDLGFVPGDLLHSSDEDANLVRSLMHLIDSSSALPLTIQPSITTLLRSEPDSWQEIIDFSNAQGTGMENVHADQIMEYRTLGSTAFQGGVL